MTKIRCCYFVLLYIRLHLFWLPTIFRLLFIFDYYFYFFLVLLPIFSFNCNFFLLLTFLFFSSNFIFNFQFFFYFQLFILFLTFLSPGCSKNLDHTFKSIYMQFFKISFFLDTKSIHAFNTGWAKKNVTKIRSRITKVKGYFWQKAFYKLHLSHCPFVDRKCR